ncbi:acyltransferase family protein [Patescibacteria group bacterium]|nr:acyltransferase family protein [Patescibacteria group bacterium]
MHKKERIHWVDIARGIGILFVMYAHVLGNQGIRYWFYAFHMPLFFFLSGVVFKKYDSFGTFFKKSVKGLLIPYFIFAILMYGIWIINRGDFNLLSNTNVKQFLSIFYGNGNDGLMLFNDVLWFLPALFVTRVIFASIVYVTDKTKRVVLTLFVFSVVGYVFSLLFPSTRLPFGIETALSAVVFYGAGHLWFSSEKGKEIIIKYRKVLFPSLIVVMTILATIGFNYFGHQIDMRANRLNNYFLFYFDAFAGTFAWIAFSVMLNKNTMLEYLGRNSLILFAWHPIIFNYLRQFVTGNFSSDIINNIKFSLPAIFTAIAGTVILSVNLLLKKIRNFKTLNLPGR